MSSMLPFLLVFLMPIFSHAQTGEAIKFEYDDNGQRVKRFHDPVAALSKPGRNGDQPADTVIGYYKKDDPLAKITESDYFVKAYPNPVHDILYIENLSWKDADASVSFLDGATAISGPNIYNSDNAPLATTYGSFMIGINGFRADGNSELFAHEYGHYMQSQASGPLYLYKYGIPSALTGSSSGLFGWDPVPHTAFRGDHDDHWVERDASRRGFEHFGLPEDEDEFPQGPRQDVKWYEPFVFMIDPLAVIRLNRPNK
jgi:hypothetical protein